MTVIVGVVDKKTKKVYMASDKGFFEDDGTHYVSPEPKIIKKKIGMFKGKPINMIIGGAGDVKPWNIIVPWKTAKLNYDPTVLTPHEFIIKIFVPKLKSLLEASGYKAGPKSESIFLIGFEGSLFKIQEGDYGVVIPPEYGMGIGGASIPAVGVLYALDKMKSKIGSRQKVRLAVEASINVSKDAKGPIDILVV